MADGAARPDHRPMTPAQLTVFRELIATPALPRLGPESRPGVKPAQELAALLERFFADHTIAASLHDLLRSAALLWHDHLDASHTLSQGIHNRSGSFLHGIMHRREPDYGNAKYWFHRAGSHPAYAAIAAKLEDFVAANQARAEWKPQLAPRGVWDPDAFVDACEMHARRSGTPDYAFLQQVQAVEFDALIESL